jgi:DNA-binding PadR family transcriptional regulator
VLLRIQQISGGHLQIEQGALYPALYRLETRGLLQAEWGVSDNNRQAKFYTLTRPGKRRLAEELDGWQAFSTGMSLAIAARSAELAARRRRRPDLHDHARRRRGSGGRRVPESTGCSLTSLASIAARQQFPFRAAAAVAGGLGLLALLLTAVGHGTAAARYRRAGGPLLACLLPVRRALGVQPMDALRQD